MSHTAVKAIPDGMNTVTPHLVCENASEAISFYIKAFGAKELVRMPMPNGKLMHACIEIGGSRIFLVDEMEEMSSLDPKRLGGSPVYIHLQVEDADAVASQAIAAGATSLLEVQEMFWGDRYGQVKDPFGHLWSIATHVKDVDPASWY